MGGAKYLNMIMTNLITDQCITMKTILRYFDSIRFLAFLGVRCLRLPFERIEESLWKSGRTLQSRW